MVTPIRATDAIALPFPPEIVWPVLAAVWNYPDWWPPSLRLRVISGGSEPLGTELEIRPPVGRAFRCRVEELQAPRWIRMRYHGDFVRGTGVWHLEPSGSGSCVTYDLDVHARGWLVALLARVVDLAALHSRQMRAVLRNLQHALQQEQDRLRRST